MTQTLIIGPCPAGEEPAQLEQTSHSARLNRLEVDYYQAAIIAPHALKRIAGAVALRFAELAR